MGSEHWDDNGCCTRCGTKGNAYQACVNCTGLSQHGLAMQQRAQWNQIQQTASGQLDRLGKTRAPEVYEDNVALRTSVETLKIDLAASEKERERLKAQLNEKTPHVDPMTGICTGCGTSRMERAAQDAIRLELENLKRSTDSRIADWTAIAMSNAKEHSGLKTAADFYKRELDRERAKRKRGL